MTAHISLAIADAHGRDFHEAVCDLLGGRDEASPFEDLTADVILDGTASTLAMRARGYSPSLHACRLALTLSGGPAGRSPATTETRNAAILMQLRQHVAQQSARRDAIARTGGSDPLASHDPTTLGMDHLHVDAAQAAAAALMGHPLEEILRQALHRMHGGSSNYAGGYHMDTRYGSVAEGAMAGDGQRPGTMRTGVPDAVVIRTVAAPIAIMRGDKRVATVRGRGVRLETYAPEAIISSLPGCPLGTVARLHPVLDASIVETATLVGDISGNNPAMPPGIQIRLMPSPLLWDEAIAMSADGAGS